MTDKEFAVLLPEPRTRGDVKKLKWAFHTKAWEMAERMNLLNILGNRLFKTPYIPTFRGLTFRVMEGAVDSANGIKIRERSITIKDLRMLKKIAEA